MPIYAKNARLRIRKIKVRVYKIDESTLRIQRMVLAIVSFENKLSWVWFFEEFFLLVDISMEVI